MALQSASGRVDFHSEFGAFFSPRVSLLCPHNGLDRAAVDRHGLFAPTPFLDEIDDIGLWRLEQLGDLEAERGRSASLDMGWRHRRWR